MILNGFNLGAKYAVYTKPIEATKDQVSGDWLKPAYATDVELIPEKAGYKRYFVKAEKAWHYVVDNVGKEYWEEDGTKHVIKELGEELPEDALLEEPTIPPTREEQKILASQECSKRIDEHWNYIGQINASLGVYGELDTANCAAWISSNRAALIALLEREDLLEIDVKSDEHWPIFEDDSE
jgi:hypothetical protein